MEANKVSRPRPGALACANPVEGTEASKVEDPATPHQYGIDNNDLTSIHTKDDGTII